MARKAAAAEKLTPARIVTALEGVYGKPKRRAAGDVLRHLVIGILADGVTVERAERAFEQLSEVFVDLNELRVAKRSEIRDAIRTLEDADAKAQVLRGVCMKLFVRHNAVDLEFLVDKAESTVRREFAGLEGVSENAICYAMLYALGQNVCPITERTSRVAKRLGLIPRHLSQEEAGERLREIVPGRSAGAFALLVDVHAERVCTARGPGCATCVLAQVCESA